MGSLPMETLTKRQRRQTERQPVAKPDLSAVISLTSQACEQIVLGQQRRRTAPVEYRPAHSCLGYLPLVRISGTAVPRFVARQN